MSIHPLAGKPAPLEALVNIPRLISAYYTLHPDPQNAAQAVAFGTSGHRGTSLNGSFNEDHVLAISQAIYEYRRQAGINGAPLHGGWTRTRFPSRRSTARLRCLPATAWKS
jgi:Phosphoglucomutase